MNSKMLMFTNCFCAVIVSVLLIGCKGDDGTIGPVGPAGAQGTTGAKGDVGTANVIYSPWVVATVIVDSTVDNSLVRVGHIAAPQITADILAKGDVHVYLSFGAGTFPLPYTSYAGSKVSTISFWPKVGKIIPYRFTHDNSNAINLSATLQYRYIIIPGGVASARQAPMVDFSDYAAVCKYYGIAE